jgi:hypothetical protein
MFMAVPKKYVSVKCDVKDKSLKGVKFDAVAKAAVETISAAINGKSSGKLSTKDKSPNGFLFTANVITLKGDNAEKPTKLDAKVAIIAMTVGSSAKAFNGTANGSMKGVGNIQSSAEDLVSSVLESFMPKAISTMLSFK